MKYFVYGTLKYLQSNHHLLRGKSTRIAVGASVPNMKLYDLVAFPAAVMSADANDKIYGEIYEPHEDKGELVRQLLDRLEGHPHLYERQTRIATDANGDHHEVQIYVFLHSVQGYKHLPDGRWGERVTEKEFASEGEGK